MFFKKFWRIFKFEGDTWPWYIYYFIFFVSRYLANSLGKENIRVNAISAGPVKTLAASGIKSFRKMLSYNASRAPLMRNITTEEVGNAAAFLCSDLASGITGEILYVDAGFNITAMGDLSEVD